MPQKILTILRHAKAAPVLPGQHDRERTLAERGIRQAKIMGEYLAARRMIPQLVLCSDAVRTRETLKHLQETCRGTLEVEYIHALYMASASEMMHYLAAVPEVVSSVMVIGHNPGMHELCMKLVKDGNESLINQMSTAYPTCAMSTIAFDCRWSEVPKKRGTLLDFMTPEVLAN